MLRSFHVIVGDFRECAVHAADEGVSCQEEITLRFPNQSFRDTFLQTAFRVALEHDLNFTWENRASIFNQDMTPMPGSNITAIAAMVVEEVSNGCTTFSVAQKNNRMNEMANIFFSSVFIGPSSANALATTASPPVRRGSR